MRRRPVSECVLDASAVLALLNGEPGHAVVEAALPGARINAVNLAEVVGKLADVGLNAEEIGASLSVLGLQVQPCDEAIASRAGLLRPLIRAQGLSLGDRVCLATAAELALPVVTAEHVWAPLTLTLGLDIQQIR